MLKSNPRLKFHHAEQLLPIRDHPQTSVEGVFAGGDAVSGPKSVIQAVVSARRAADNIHSYIMGCTKRTGRQPV